MGNCQLDMLARDMYVGHVTFAAFAAELVTLHMVHLMRHVGCETLGCPAIKAAWRQPQLMLSNDSPGGCAAIVHHHMQALGPPELQLPLPHLQVAALRS